MDELDRRQEVDRKLAVARSKRANTIAIFRSGIEQYPKTEYEKKVVPKGVRLCHFVIGWECEKCEYSYYDHTLGCRWQDETPGRTHVVKICLKDWIKKGYGTESEIMCK